MRNIPESELDSSFERDVCWGDDQRHFFNPKRKKGSVMGYFLRFNCVIEVVQKYAKPGARVADFAGANCNFSLTLAEKGFDVTAVDINQDFLKYGNKKYTHGRFHTVHANIIEYRTQEPYDLIIVGEVIEHVAFPGQLLKSVWENLKPGGYMVLTTPNGNEYGQPLPTYTEVTDIEALIPRQFHWGDHLFLYTEAELRDLFKAQQFQVCELLKINSSYVSQLKAVRYLMPMPMLLWLEEKYRRRSRRGKDSTNNIIVVAQKPASR